MKITYKDVLVPKVWVGSFDRIYDMAVSVGYEYFLWNERVYRVAVGGNKDVIDTGLLERDLDQGY